MRVSDFIDSEQLRWFSIKLFERDEKVVEQLSLPTATLNEVEKIFQNVRKRLMMTAKA